MREVKIEKIYKHFKGNLYKVLDIVYDSELYTEENPKYTVIYECLNTNKKWARPYDLFVSKVDKEKYPDVLQEYRFEEVD